MSDLSPGQFCFRSNVTVGEIQCAVANAFDIPQIEMISARRAQPIALVRQLAMHLARELTPYSLPNLGRLFGNRDHTTIMHGLKVAQKRLNEDAKLREKVERVRADLMAADASWRQTILDHIDDPSVRKIVVMRWWEHREISADEAEALIHRNELEAA